ncbi:class I SAM-dependent methyltransferase [Polynucleobacter paneuropaeus]|uniref:class I SAM-dependent methyltransferase n=1 Tax=Polynucleobacter paneuropaeus TaxID=2527775 RepID=UPI001BFD14F5|nr:methyltransferase domain-containing protein [Polynucleobacter paneuropaeus]MBT8633209.1 class I SAM-dependent methyltransferase [Polynucleobacter paneuropaeus]
MRLTDQEYWERVNADNSKTAQSTSLNRNKWLRRILGSTFFKWSEPYDDYILWEVILPSYLKNVNGFRAIEIGSAPGKFMTKLADHFGVIPYGIEYTSVGAAANRVTFLDHGYDPEGVIEADVLSPVFQAKYKGIFDIVISRGFIEHFSDPQDVLDAHMSLLKPGGVLLVMIPNLRGIYWIWTRIFNELQLPLHNLDIMKMGNFRALFSPFKLRRLHIQYIGTFSFWLFTAKDPSLLMRKILRGLILLQRVLNVCFRLFFGRRGFETAWLSPNLLFIGKKCPD